MNKLGRALASAAGAGTTLLFSLPSFQALGFRIEVKVRRASHPRRVARTCSQAVSGESSLLWLVRAGARSDAQAYGVRGEGQPHRETARLEALPHRRM